MDFLVTTDTHLGIKKSNSIWEKIIFELFVAICTYAKENNLTEKFVHLGDFHDTRKSLNVSSINNGLDIIEMLSDTFDDVYLILGNHDTYFKDRIFPHSLRVYEKITNVHIIDEPFVLDDITFIPWFIDDIPVKEILSNPDTKYVFGHLGINEAHMNASGTEARQENLKMSDFNNVDGVWSGHFHTPGVYGNVNYIGSPFHMDFNDAGERGFYHWSNGDIKLIPYDAAPKFIKLIAQDDIYYKDEFKGNILHLLFKENFGVEKNTEIVKMFQSFDLFELHTSYEFEETFTEEGIELNEGEILSKKEILFDYYKNTDTIPDHINITILTSLVNSIIEDLKK